MGCEFCDGTFGLAYLLFSHVAMTSNHDPLLLGGCSASSACRNLGAVVLAHHSKLRISIMDFLFDAFLG